MDKKAFLADFEKYFANTLDGNESVLNKIALYCAADGGKRVRPVCVYLGALAAGGECDEKQLLSLAAGIELVHSYSLVHDDLPAMDNASERRGKPSAHVAFGEANAILGGDFLLSLAFEELTKHSEMYGERFASAAAQIAGAAIDMAHGQALELAGIQTKEDYIAMCSKKTGALIKGALMAGSIAAGADGPTLDKISAYGKAVGLEFQISDDLLDSDGIVKLIGEEEARLELQLHLLQAIKAAENFDIELAEFATAIAKRKK